MSRTSITYLCVLFVLLVQSVRSETIVSDSDGHSIGLPVNGGHGTDFINGTPGRDINPYVLSVFVNDNTGETENFYLSQPDGAGGPNLFGFANITDVYYSADFTTSNGVHYGPDLTKLGNAADPLSAEGLYTFSFWVPIPEYIFVNITYHNLGPSPPAVTEIITVNLTNPGPSGVVGDPQFVGLRGQRFQVHGIDGAVYNLISEQSTQVNARFVFLSSGACPVFNGVAASDCWSHPGSYLGEVSFQQLVDGQIHKLLVTAGPASVGFASIVLDGKRLAVGAASAVGSLAVAFSSSHLVSIRTEHFSFELSNSDMFVNQAVAALVPLDSLAAHGLLGQTHVMSTDSAAKCIAGDVDDYAIADRDIFGDEFIFNQFHVTSDVARH